MKNEKGNEEKRDERRRRKNKKKVFLFLAKKKSFSLFLRRFVARRFLLLLLFSMFFETLPPIFKGRREAHRTPPKTRRSADRSAPSPVNPIPGPSNLSFATNRNVFGFARSLVLRRRLPLRKNDDEKEKRAKFLFFGEIDVRVERKKKLPIFFRESERRPGAASALHGRQKEKRTLPGASADFSEFV